MSFMAFIGWRDRKRGERVFALVLGSCMAVAGASALMVASCLGQHDTLSSEPSYVQTTSAPAAQGDNGANTNAAAAPPSTVVVQAPAQPVNVTVNNQFPDNNPAGNNPTGAVGGGSVTYSNGTTTPPVQNGAAQGAQGSQGSQGQQAQFGQGQAPLVSGGIASPTPLVNGSPAPTYTAAPYGTGYVQPNPAANPNNALNNASPTPNGSSPGDSTVTNNGTPSNQGGGAGNLGAGGGATTPATTPTANTAPATRTQ